uniref:Uncharacterized protein n=1 Tax=Lepeophtheirus salmonis TaxID=72036 RepID=A0A0K2V765_LEPSM
MEAYITRKQLFTGKEPMERNAISPPVPSISRTPKKTCILHPHSSHTTSECRVIQEQLAKEKESPRPPVHQRKSNNERKGTRWNVNALKTVKKTN